MTVHCRQAAATASGVGLQAPQPIADNQAMTATPPAPELRQLALQALLEPDSQQKVLLTQSLHAQTATIFIANNACLEAPAGLPGCPARPELRTHLDMPKRSPFT
ncbi:MAG: hypothetical protein JWP96_1235, partial [Polaromonas sp.]|nr:hypothetical protein [Polaromonas sp.]